MQYVSKPVRTTSLFDTIARTTGSLETKNVVRTAEKAIDGKEVFDYEEALKQCLNKKSLLDRVLRQFLQEVGPMRLALEQTLSQGESDLAFRAAHKFKGAAGAIAARRSFACAAEVEHAARAGDMGKARYAFVKLNAEILELSATIEEVLKANGLNPDDKTGGD